MTTFSFGFHTHRLVADALRTIGIALALSVTVAHAAPHSVVSPAALANAISEHRADVPEFQFIRKQAKALGIRVWLFGGTAAGYGHYAKWDLLRKSGDPRFQPDRFDYDYTNIYRSTQDADLVVDGPPESAQKLAQALAQNFPHLQGSKSSWEVRMLKQALGAKDALLDNPDYLNQHTDSNSTGMIELTDPPIGETVIRDLRDWKSPVPVFLKDLAEGMLHYYHSDRHHETKRAKAGDNPEIFSAVRLLTKAFQYELRLRPEDWIQVQSVIDRFDPKRDLTTPYSRDWLEKNGKKLIQHAVNIEYAWDTLERLGLRNRLIALKNDAETEQSLAWWLSKEPLRDYALATKGRTARDVFATPGAPSSTAPIVLAHETNTFLAYESITRAHTGDPNVLISRKNQAGEAAHFGDGFYTRIGREGARRTGHTIRFTLDPNAREGADFFMADKDYVVILNKRAIRVIPESLQKSLLDYFRILASGSDIELSDRGILEKLRRRHRSEAVKLSHGEMEEIFLMVEGQLRSNQRLSLPLFSEFFALSPALAPQARVDRIVESLLANLSPEASGILGLHVFESQWIKERSESLAFTWVETGLKRPNLSSSLIARSILRQSEHFRSQARTIQLAIDLGQSLADLVSQTLVPHWAGRPEFPGFITQILEKRSASADENIARHALSRPEYQDRFDWLETLLKNSQGNGATARAKKAILDHALAAPHWRNQTRVVQLAIDLDFELPNVVLKILKSHWEDRGEFSDFISQILKKSPLSHNAIASSILRFPRHSEHTEWLETVLKNPDVDRYEMIRQILAQPHWRNHPDFPSWIRKASTELGAEQIAELAKTLPEITQYAVGTGSPPTECLNGIRAALRQHPLEAPRIH